MARNRLLSAALVYTGSQLFMYDIVYRQFSTNIKIKIITLIPVLLDQAFGQQKLTKPVSIIQFYFIIREMLSFIRCKKHLLSNLLGDLPYSGSSCEISCLLGTLEFPNPQDGRSKELLRLDDLLPKIKQIFHGFKRL